LRAKPRSDPGAVGVLFPESLAYAFADPAAVATLAGAAAELEPAGLALLLLPASADAPTAVRALTDAVLDGLLLYSMPRVGPLLEAALGPVCASLRSTPSPWATATSPSSPSASNGHRVPARSTATT
jgi:hypothetical protein